MKKFNFYTSVFTNTDWIKLMTIGCLLWIISSSPCYATDYLCFTAEEAEASVKLDSIGTPSYDITLMTSSNGTNWTEYTLGKNILLKDIGDKVYFKAKEYKDNHDTIYRYWSNHYQFFIPKKVSASGNIMSLLDSTCQRNDVPNGAFCCLFENCKGLTSAPALPATKLSEGCYERMFLGCESLRDSPLLPATILAKSCYSSMFSGCNFKIAPKLPATILAEDCYSMMFIGCNFTISPELPATTLADGCYWGMFWGCKNLTDAPKLPATNLAKNCYGCMFYNCKGLRKAPKLPATVLADYCYGGMFSACSSLTKAPNLPAFSLEKGCYTEMFKNCPNLNHVSVSFSNWDTNSTADWLSVVAPTGTFICPNSLPIEFGKDRIPTGWKIQHKPTAATQQTPSIKKQHDTQQPTTNK